MTFAIAPVENQNRVAGGQTQHVAEIIALAALKADRFARGQRGIDEQPGRSKIELRHGRGSHSEVPFSLCAWSAKTCHRTCPEDYRFANKIMRPFDNLPRGF